MYTNERNFQILISLLKEHNVRTIIASPGTTNVTFVASIQKDPFFRIFSAPDERSAAYMACGYAAQSGEPVVLTCTGATASRNYMPGLTEAFYRKLPVIAVTSARHVGYIGQLTPQAIDRYCIPNDVAQMSVQIPSVHTKEDEWNCNLKINTALLNVKYRGGGPVHINIVTEGIVKFNCEQLPYTRVIHRYLNLNKLPKIEAKRVAIFIGNHSLFSAKLTTEIEKFCEQYNGCVFYDHTSNYHGKYGVAYNLIADQKELTVSLSEMDLLIDIGEVSGSYMQLKPHEVWRVSEDGKIKDRFKVLSSVFEMSEQTFFEKYNSCENKVGGKISEVSYYEHARRLYSDLRNNMPEVPFSNIWVAKEMSSRLPENCNLHFGILNSLRSWNFFELAPTINCFCNTGGFGIDGILSTVIGASIADEKKLNFCVVGDLAFFYDMNSLGNRHISNNIRILLINNGLGTEFRNYSHMAYQFGEAADAFIAAAGHYGNKSPNLVRHYATDLGFEYLSANSKQEFKEKVSYFVSGENKSKPMIFEIFTSNKDESDALKAINHIKRDPPSTSKQIKTFAKKALGEKGINMIKKVMQGE